MSKRTERISKNCPEWCTEGSVEHPCRGEHYAISAGSYIPASGGHFPRAEASDSGKLPLIGVGLYWAEAWGEGQEVTLTIGDDAQVNFKPGEAIDVATEMVIMLQAMVHASGVSITNADRVAELVSVSKALAGSLGREGSA